MCLVGIVNCITRDLAKVASDAFIGGHLARKAGLTHFHVGPGRKRLAILRQLIDEFDVKPGSLYPTHVERTVPLALPNQSSPTTAAELPTLQGRTTGLEATPVQTETSRRLKARKNTPVARDMGIIEISSAAESEDSDEDLQPSIDTDQHEYSHQDDQVHHAGRRAACLKCRQSPHHT